MTGVAMVGLRPVLDFCARAHQSCSTNGVSDEQIMSGYGVTNLPVGGSSVSANVAVDVQAWRNSIRSETAGHYHYEMGRAIRREDNIPMAIEAFQRALAERPEHVLTHHHLIESLKAVGRDVEAEALFASFAAHQPRYWEESQAHALADAASEHVAARRFTAAVALVDQAWALAPQGEAKGELVDVCLRIAETLGCTTTALPILHKAFEIAPDDLGVAMQYGNLCDRLERYEDAAVAYRAVLRIDGRRGATINALSIIAGALCRFGEALELVEHSLALNPEVGRSHIARGVGLHGLGRIDEAITTYERAVRCDSHNPHTHAYLGYALLTTGRVAEAEEHIARAIRMEAGNPVLTTWSGLVMHRRGRLDEAAALYRRALEITPNLCIALMNLGLALEDAGRPVEARDMFAQAVAHRSRALWQWVMLHPFAADRLAKTFQGLGYDGP